MIRIILREVDCEAAVGAGAPIETRWETINIEHPILEQWLCEKRGAYITRSIQGAVVEPHQPIKESERSSTDSGEADSTVPHGVQNTRGGEQ